MQRVGRRRAAARGCTRPAGASAGSAARRTRRRPHRSPFATRIFAHAPAPPRCSFATVGPSTGQNMKKKFPIPKTTTVDQSQVREVNSSQPSRSSRRKCGCSVGAARAGIVDPREQERRARERGGVDREGDPRAAGDDDDPADRRPDHEDQVPHHPAQRVRLLEPLVADRLRHQARLGRDHERVGRPVDDLEHDEQHERRVAGEDDGRGRRLRRALADRRPDQDPVARQPVGEHAAVQDERSVRELPAGEDDRQVEPASAISVRSRTANASAMPATESPSVEIVDAEKKRRYGRSRQRREPGGEGDRRHGG